MELSPRLLAFLEYEMKEIKNDRDRDNEDRQHASSILGKVQAELEGDHNSDQSDVRATELFS